MSMTPEERKARRAEQNRQHYQANKEKVVEQKRQHYQANKEKVVERNRQHYQANKEKVVERNRQYREANKEKVVERNRQYREANKEKVAETARQHREANKEKLAEQQRQRNRSKGFAREDGSSFQAWLASLTRSHKVFLAIANLTPNPGQTLAELIHELSGYAMEVCEQIANPPVAEDDLPAQPTPQPDLF